MKQLKNPKGITLIALVITIIILLILAGISISSLTNNGLFEKAQEADRKTEIEGIKENIQLDIYGKYLSNLGPISSEELVSILDDYGTVNYEDNGTIKGITTKKGYEISISDIYTGEISGETPVLTITDTADTKPSQAMPEGATVIENDLSKGIVIADTNGNEWTWVEVPKTTVFTTATSASDYDNIKTDLVNYATDYREGKEGQGYSWTDEWYDGCGVADSTTYTQMYNKMLSSVYTNGGFWISRYEIGDATATENNTTRTKSSGATGIAISKANQIPYNWITCSQAQTLASGMSTDTNKTSSLLFGIQWDLTCKFLEENTDLELAEINSDSIGWGNYMGATVTNIKTAAKQLLSSVWTELIDDKPVNSNIILTTGASEYTNKMNIYDFAGNEGEWTLEYATSRTGYPCAGRGGYTEMLGFDFPASYRDDRSSSISQASIAFRTTLY